MVRRGGKRGELKMGPTRTGQYPTGRDPTGLGERKIIDGKTIRRIRNLRFEISKLNVPSGLETEPAG
jgi:hypothetical protein